MVGRLIHPTHIEQSELKRPPCHQPHFSEDSPDPSMPHEASNPDRNLMTPPHQTQILQDPIDLESSPKGVDRENPRVDPSKISNIGHRPFFQN
ncbi:hypothetical protein QVD17_28233 [Tagetes erecta]|uniref:Uncharacterized protein n=1 Tax=Tagetes erecta TaxID=13708 RepID=A0AAD8KCZ0_TARER|nr:hypothetical protein QVD17_28233 [Tagetes erecta]